MRPPAEVVHDRLDGAKGRLELHAVELVHGHVAAPRPWAVDSSASSAAAKRTSSGKPTAGNRCSITADALDRLAGVLARDRVLHLGEAHPALGGEDPVGVV